MKTPLHIRLLQRASKILNKINNAVFKIPPPPNVKNITADDLKKSNYNTAIRRLPGISIGDVEVLGLFIYNKARLEEFKQLFEKNEIEKFQYNTKGFQPYEDYATVLRVVAGNDTYVLIEVQYFDFAKDKELVFLKKG